MKNILLLFAFVISFHFTAKSQYVTIPDQNFRIYLKTNYPSCFDSIDRLDTTCSIINTITDLYMASQGFFSIEGIRYFKKLRTLNCNYNDLITMPPLPDSLRELNMVRCRVVTFEALPPKLERLDFNGNLVAALPPLPNTLTYLYGPGNRLTTLPALPNSLTWINCYNNRITSLPAMPNALTYLECTGNFLTTLPPVPNTLGALYCSNNSLTQLPDLSATTLFQLECRFNNLTELPKLPNSLHYISCTYNQLTTLPILPSLLEDLYCDNNKLVTIPALPNTLGNLSCYTNKLAILPSLPNALTYLNCSDNPLKCLPLLPFGLTNLYVKNTFIPCISRVPTYYDTLLPVCADIQDLCVVNPLVKGKVYYDANNNGVYNNGEELLAQQIVKVVPNNWLGASDADGNYLVKLDTAINNTWSAISNQRYTSVTPASYSLANIHSLGLQSGSYDFGFHIIPNVYDLETVLGSSPARPGFITTVTVTANNVGTVSQSDVIIKLKKPNGLNFISASIDPTSIVDDTLIWNNININYFESQSINVQLQVPAGAAIGAQIEYEAWANGTQADTTPADNYAKWTETIRGSFDPNDKLVNKTSLPPTYNADKDRLLYTIRFQNTGNDVAFTVIVRDIIPDNLDVTSLRVVNASHPYQLIVREKNIVEVAFPNIQLPDKTTNEAKSHGFVQLEFKPKTGLPLNAEINNNASIFFDYNLPVITNTATTKVQITTGIANNKKLAFKLFPNPTSEKIMVELPYAGKGKWQLTDISGKIIQQNNIENNTTDFTISVNGVANGTYLLSLEVNGKMSTSKVVITR